MVSSYRLNPPRPNRYILLSSYLSHLKVLPLQSTSSTLYTLPLPTSLGATCCSWLSATSADSPLVGAGSLDRLGHIFAIPSLLDTTAQPEEILTLYGHTGPISSITPSKNFAQVLTASWDTTLHVYSLPTAEKPLSSMSSHDLPAEPTSYLPGQNRSKKRRVVPESTSGEATARGEGTAGWRKAPEVIMRGHTARVGGGMWDKQESGRVWSTAWDGSVRGWDAENGYGDVVKQGPQDRAGLCIDQLSGSGTLITGNMDRTICLWDTREGALLESGWIFQSSGKAELDRCSHSDLHHFSHPTHASSRPVGFRPPHVILPPFISYLLWCSSDLGCSITKTSAIQREPSTEGREG